MRASNCALGHPSLLTRDGGRSGRAFTRDDLRAAIMPGAIERVRPKTMTVIAIIAGLMPILWSIGTGSVSTADDAMPPTNGTAIRRMQALGGFRVCDAYPRQAASTINSYAFWSLMQQAQLAS